MSLMLRLQIVSWTVTAAMSATLYWLVWQAVPAPRLYGAVAVTIAFLGWSGFSIIRRRCGLVPAADNPSNWHDHTVMVSWAMNAAAAIVFWLLMPYAKPETLVFAILLIVTIAVVQAGGTVRSPRRGPPGRWARWTPLPLPLIAMAYLVIHPTQLAVPLIAFLAAVAVLVLLLRNNMQSSLERLYLARREAEDAKDARTRFLAAASHVLRQPLQAARLFVGQARRARAGEERDRMLDNATAALEAIDRLAEQSLDHLRADFEPAAILPVPLAPVIRDTTGQFAASASPAGVAITAIASSRSVLAVNGMLARALGNLVDNAIKHGAGRRLLVGVKRRGAKARLYVIDDGHGLGGQEDRDLFAPFVQGPSSGAGARGGFGLGLANVRRFAQAMGGLAGHDPRWRRGAAFYIELPLVPEGGGDAVVPDMRRPPADA